MLGASGHIAGVVNPAAKKRRSHWVGDALSGRSGRLAVESAVSSRAAGGRSGREWLGKHGGGSRKAPAKAGSAKYKPIEPAPGRYVKQRIH